MVEIEINEPERTKPYIVVGIPAFNEEQTIARVILDAQKFADKVVVCDDGSTDYTAKIAKRLGAVVVHHEMNIGYGASIQSLFLRAHDLQADILVTLDGDGQHTGNEIPSIITPLLNGEADIVIGSRFVDKHGTAEMPLYRQIGAKIITGLVNGSSKNGITDAQCGFRAYNRQALDNLRVLENGMSASVEILLEASKANLKIFEVPCTCKYDISDVTTSSEHPLAHGIGVVGSIIRLVVEEKPLIVLGLPGVVFLFLGVFFGVWMLQLYVELARIVTNVALVSIAFLMMGFFMLSTGITLYALRRLSAKIRKEE